MPDKQEIQSVAKNWIERYGSEVLKQLKQRLSELEEHGEQEAHSLWTKIYDETKKQIEAAKPSD
jgi:gas vesicle protein